jgi:hypothetical protein
MSTDGQAAFEGWCILEVFGHRKLGGYLREQELASASFLRIDIPAVDGRAPATQFYAPTAVYAITPCTEEIARSVAGLFRPEPVSRWDLRAIEAPRRVMDDDDPFAGDPDPGDDEEVDPGRLPFD